MYRLNVTYLVKTHAKRASNSKKTPSTVFSVRFRNAFLDIRHLKIKHHESFVFKIA